jgi:hypothetical protein
MTNVHKLMQPKITQFTQPNITQFTQPNITQFMQPNIEIGIDNGLLTFTQNKEILNSKSIQAFQVSVRKLNDKNNKTRENIICAICNNQVPDKYYKLPEWFKLKKSINEYIGKLSCLRSNSKHYVRIKCKTKAGCGNKYDFLIKLFNDDDSNEDFKVELKFNASMVEEAPQIVSPMNPGQFMTSDYVIYYYNNYLQTLSDKAQAEMPSLELYLKQINSREPACMKAHQEMYYKGSKGSSKFTNDPKHIKFYEYAKKLSNESISTFITNTELNLDLLSEYLYNTQRNKIYMLCLNMTFTLQQVNFDDYSLVSVVKNANMSRFECTSKTGRKFYVLLRWKNGNGIAFPAFQISFKKKNTKVINNTI